jgi:hypothetical protein
LDVFLLVLSESISSHRKRFAVSFGVEREADSSQYVEVSIRGAGVDVSMAVDADSYRQTMMMEISEQANAPFI